VFIYRDTSGQPDGAAADFSTRDRAEHDSDYWYSLLAGDATPRREETRGPFEPLMSSGDPPRAAHEQPVAPGAGAAGIDQAGTKPGQALPGAERDAGADQTAQARARKLEQLKDLYLTAEAIGEQNVDKHFDQLLAQQRQLISEYFSQASAAGPAETGPPETGPAETGAGVTGPGRTQAAEAGPVVASPRNGPRDDAGIAAEQPRAW
jgi:hypothetical protein